MKNKGIKITLIGPPGSGKGTQATLIEKKYGSAHLSSGDILRSEVSRGTEFGNQIKHFMDRGEIGPVELITEVILNYLQANCNNGFILDGFPRTIYQAEELGKRTPLDCALYISVPEEEIIKRITGRRTCGNCKKIYHIVHNPPEQEGICQDCGGTLIRRSDDTEETVINRIRVYNEETRPVIEYYKKQGLLHEINGVRNSGEIFEDITKILL